ncbi:MULTISPECIES: LysR substrate-binding domain-containing protein [unclassified Pseudomonas]|uniref:LysR family transcriptional regulator n=1 Tax=unclassified Pseudomonas TaxID=196821 RepID=UPI002AC8BE40|nr:MULTISPECIES: LysR substrate-binding domain-containing protein [unclassified Pseudomonas]MEB0042220.1 LysR substrate-binding domain-containing protein [Pseudomonas sp. MH10]MEB0119593.1 LysR substrate-binding domain-containing protein [Pseudomonas sp. CCI1.2]WPX65196.1 LysR substrate-binding domain-containing protein [Pseudomonas sp. MH10]
MANTLDIDLLRTFHAVVRFGQFLAASAFLNRSPSAVSLHVRRLEDVVGGQLFERDNQTVALTPLGRRFALHTAQLLRLHDQVLDSFSHPVASGRVRLGISEEYAGALLHCTLPSLTTHFPHIELEIETGSSGRLRTRLTRGQLDLALVVEPMGVPSPDHQPARTFGTTQPIWVAAHQYRIDSTRPVPLALHGKGCPYRAVAIDALAHAQRRWRTVVMSAGGMALEMTISAGLAIGIIDRARIGTDMRELTLDDGFPELPLHELKLMKAPGNASAAVEVMVQLISEHFRL